MQKGRRVFCAASATGGGASPVQATNASVVQAATTPTTRITKLPPAKVLMTQGSVAVYLRRTPTTSETPGRR